MVLISEWLPNPIGSDATGEWVELFNDGKDAVNLAGWRLENGTGKKAMLSGEIAPNGYLVFKRTGTKLTLRNSDEELSLYDTKGNLVHQSVLLGTAPEGKSMARPARQSFSEKNVGGIGDRFIMANPTPGGPNQFAQSASIAQNMYPIGRSLNSGVSGINMFMSAIVLGAILSAISIYVIKTNHGLSELFFGRY